jgi:nucleoside-diphosphate kinase
MATERTLVLFKPDAVQRRLVGELYSRFERKGLKIIGLKMLKVTPELSKQHYAEHVSKPFYPMLESFITAGPSVALAVEGPEAVAVVRAMLGPTNGRQAPLGTIRGDFGVSRQMNLVHGSDSTDASAREISIYFKPEELIDYSTSLGPWVCADDEK